MGFGKALEALQLEIAEIAVRQQIRQHIVPVLVPRSSGRAGIATEDNFERRIGRIAGEILVGEYVDSAGMVHGQQLHLVEIDGLFQRLHEPETELAVFLANRVARNLDVFRGARNVTLVGPDPVADYARAQHVADQFVVRAVPGEQGGAGTAPAVHFQETRAL